MALRESEYVCANCGRSATIFGDKIRHAFKRNEPRPDCDAVVLMKRSEWRENAERNSAQSETEA
jgi:DNA-directed RNA polymerase subunit RPC12/RpoP